MACADLKFREAWCQVNFGDLSSEILICKNQTPSRDKILTAEHGVRAEPLASSLFIGRVIRRGARSKRK